MSSLPTVLCLNINWETDYLLYDILKFVLLVPNVLHPQRMFTLPKQLPER